MPKWSWVVGAVAVVLLGGAVWVYQTGFLVLTKIDIAADQSNNLMRACHAYRQKPQADGKFPARLRDLIEPPEGMVPVLDGGPLAIIDPWGEEFKYAVIETKAGPVPYVWCVWEHEEKLKVIGARLSGEGNVQPIWWPD